MCAAPEPGRGRPTPDAAGRARPPEDQQLRTGDRVTQGLAVRQRQQRVAVAVDHQRRRHDVAEATACRPVVLDGEVVDQRRRVVPGACHVMCRQGSDRGVVEVRRATGVRPRAGDHVVDHRGRVGDVRLGRHRQVARRRRQVVGTGRGRHERQRRDPVGMVHAEDESGPAEHRLTDHMGGPDAQGVLDTEHVEDEIRVRVGRPSRWAAGRATGVPVVVADHEPAVGGELFAQVGVPPQHRGGRSGDQHDRRVRAVPEGLRAQLDAVDVEEVLAVRVR